MNQKNQNPVGVPNPLMGALSKAITAVPAVKYALGIVGVAAAAALITTYFKSGVTAAIVGTALLLVAMILLRVFARLALVPSGNWSLKILALLLAWVFVLLFCGFGVLTFACVFFDKPKPYPILVRTLISPLSSPELKQPTPREPQQSPSQVFKITQLTKISSLPDLMKTALAADLGSSEMSKELQSHGSLTIDGATLVVGEIGDGVTASLSVDTLRFANGGRIVTNGNTLHIQANHIDVDNGSINSFYPADISPAEAAPGAPGTKGANGGQVYVIATEGLSGVLKVNLSGENGGRGGPGLQGTPGTPGPRGQNGSDGFLNCSHGGSDGGAGGPGGQGNSGSAGGDGGSGGSLYVSKNLSHATIEFVAQGGAPGPGGVGGPGGAGGPGGEGGSGTVHCGGGHGGPNGPTGLAGDAGANGKLGNSGPPMQSL